MILVSIVFHLSFKLPETIFMKANKPLWLISTSIHFDCHKLYIQMRNLDINVVLLCWTS